LDSRGSAVELQALGFNIHLAVIDSDRVRALLAGQLATVTDPGRLAALRTLLLAEPRREERDWDYGEPGERYPYWVVAEAPDRRIMLVYCEQGFGPEFPWGVLFNDPSGQAAPEELTLGMDAQWNWYLEEAFVRSGLWPGRLGLDEPLHLPPEERFGRPSRPEA
jgi:hypothetical protein